MAAPLLAGGALGMLGVILQSPSSLRWHDAVIAALSISIILLVTTVQFGFWAQSHSTTPSEIAQWWPTMPPRQRWERVRREQFAEQRAYRRWANRAKLTFNLGLLVIWVSAALAVVGQERLSLGRWLALVCFSIAGLAELAWILLVAVGHSLPTDDPPPEIWPWTESNDPF